MFSLHKNVLISDSKMLKTNVLVYNSKNFFLKDTNNYDFKWLTSLAMFKIITSVTTMLTPFFLLEILGRICIL